MWEAMGGRLGGGGWFDGWENECDCGLLGALLGQKKLFSWVLRGGFGRCVRLCVFSSF